MNTHLSRILLPVSCSFCLIVSVLFSSVSVNAVTDTIIGDPISSTSVVSRTVSNYLGSLSYGLTVPTYLYSIPFVQTVYDQDSSLYSFDATYTYVYTLTFPSAVKSQFLTGSWNIPFHINMTSHFYVEPGSGGSITEVQPSSFTDTTFRYDLSSNGVQSDGVSVFVNYSESASLSNYSCRIDFLDYFVSQTTLDIPITFHVQGTVLDNGNDSLGRQLSAYNVETTFTQTSSYSASGIVFNQPSFHQSTEYYTILQALNASNLAGAAASPALVQDILDLLEAWTEDSNGVMVDFPYFSSQVLTYLGSIDSDTTDLVTDISSILSYFITLCDQTDQLESYLYDIYSVITSANHSSAGDTGVQVYRNLYSLLFAYVAGFTGLPRSSSSLSPSSISTSTYNRWVEIISAAIESKLDLANTVPAADLTQYAGDMSEVESVGAANHSSEVALWTDVSQRANTILSGSAVPVALAHTQVWYVAAIQYIWDHLSLFSFVISVCLIGGWIVVIFGRINQFSRLKDE